MDTTTNSTQPALAAKSSSNPFKKVVSYLQGQASQAGKNRFEGTSYLSPPGKEPQQKYSYSRKKDRSSQ